MRQFRVVLRRVIDAPSGNPFLRPLDERATIRAAYKEWTFEARSEKHARALYDEAVAMRLPEIAGFHLSGIEEVTDLAPVVAAEGE